ncbi:Arylsulfatase [Pontiella desulfatans]|uniref:Arylsulfatase n=1 Tax=Pontiella desulfatans TaxID=2750659 RepID=A0A6C2U200_PONDE|nr:sulfatase [Pontiella desulfatans]SPS73851.1 sulfatase S1_25 [Kiritimatiellales bacterium]VGO13611.1 Arylsulfatase [Pontiella desulfatans]
MMKKWIAGLLVVGAVAAHAEKKPNIVFFLTDDIRYDFFGYSGHPVVQTPNIDRLAEQGARFEQAYVNTPTCWISRASMFSGMYLRGHRYGTGAANGRTFDRRWSASSYPRLLKDAGYTVGYFGKNHVNFADGEQEKMFDQFVKIGRNPYFKKQPDGSLRHETELIGDKAETFIDSAPKDKPFSMNLCFNAAHAEDSDKKDHFPHPKATEHLYEGMAMPWPKLNDPAVFTSQPDFMQNSIHLTRYKWRWDTPEKYQHNMRNYLRMISGIDNVVGRVIEKLKAEGLYENTIFIFTADNGYYAGNRGFAGKWTHYDEALRVPLLVVDPRGLEPQVVPQIAVNVDITPTILEYAGLPVPAHYHGRSLKPFVDGKMPNDWRTDFLGEFCGGNGSIPDWEGIHGERYVYARYFDNDHEFLHDLKKDPDQLKNLANHPEYKVILEQMRKRCDEEIELRGGAFTQEERSPRAKRPPKKKGDSKNKKQKEKRS